MLEKDPNQSHNEDALKGKTFVLTQEQLEAKYTGNKNLNNILQKEFKTEGGLIKTNSADEAQNEVYIDLDHVQVLESAQMHAITYYVEIGEQEETDEPQEVYNLMYFSTDYETYHVILYKYDFSQIPFQQFVSHPELTMNVLGFIPLNDIENIYENIKQSTSQAAKSTSSVSTNNYAAVYYQFINLADCATTVVVDGQPCKGSGNPKHNYGEQCGMSGNDRATPGYSYMDFSGCGGGTPGSGGGGGGGGSVGSPGGGGGNPGGGGSTPANPIWSNPIKNPGNIFAVGQLVGGINIGTNNKNLEVLNGILENNLATLQDLHSKANDTREHGNMFIKVKKNGKYTPLANQTALQLENGSNWALNIKPAVENPFNTGILHTHTNKNTVIYVYNEPTKAVPMLSHTDIQALFFLSTANSGNDKQLSESFFGLMTGQNLYVIMFHNDATLTNFFSKYGKHFANMRVNTKLWAKIERELKDEYSKITSVSSSINPALEATMYEKALLRVLRDNNLPINFYRLPANNGQFNGTWKLLGLDTNGNVTENQGH